MAKRIRYGGILDMPRSGLLGLSTLKLTEGLKILNQEMKEREEALFAHYGLKRPKRLDEATRELINKMAHDLNITGFLRMDEIKHVGQPQKWPLFSGLLLCIRVEIFQTEHPKCSIRETFREIRQLYKYEQSADALRVRYYEARRSSFVEGSFSLFNAMKSNPKISKKKYIEALKTVADELSKIKFI